MGLFADRAITGVVDQLGLEFSGSDSKLAKSAVTQARYRLGAPPIAHLFGQTAAAWSAGPDDGYKGLGLFAVDGVTLRLQDSKENFEHFGKPGGPGGRNDAGYPQLRAACLLNVTSRLLLDAEFGPFAMGEHELAEALWKSIPDSSLTLLDRGFINYRTFFELIDGGQRRHFLVRMRSDLCFEACHELEDGSLLGALRPSASLRAQYPEVGEEIRGRIIEYQHDGGSPGRLFTTLLDEGEHPAAELVALYHERWEIELAYDEVKTHMLERKESLRSKRPEGVYQEVWGIFLAYNLIRREMALAAAQEKLPPNRISFRVALLEIRNLLFLASMSSSPGTLPRHIRDLSRKVTSIVLPERRTERRYPRHVKIKMSKFKRNRGQTLPPGASTK